MRIARFVVDDDPTFGYVVGDPGAERLEAISGDPLYTKAVRTGRTYELAEVRLLAPVIPRSKIVGIGRNYPAHAAELGNEVPSSPLMFFKPNTTVIGPGDPIAWPEFSQEVDYEGELAVVIGKIAKNVPADRAMGAVFGYTVANDVSARDVQRTDGQWARAKGFDGSCPLGPWIETQLNPEGLSIQTRVGGQVRQAGNTRDMVFDIPFLIEFMTAAFTLLPGDIILTGTPAGVGTLVPGSSVEITVEGIGTLSNPVVRHGYPQGV